MQPEDMSGGIPQPQMVERKLVVQKIERHMLAPALASEGAVEFDLEGDASHYQSGWRMVSHTFAIQEDGSGILSYILERSPTESPNELA